MLVLITGKFNYDKETRGRMDHFHFVEIKPAIDRKETASIKDAIFRRAQEKAQTITEEKTENYTSQAKNDVMEIARETIQSSPMNPFNQFMDNLGIQIDKPEVKESIDPLEKVASKSELEIPKLGDLSKKEIKHNIESVQDKTFANSVKEETMARARAQFRTNLSNTLIFLNTQAAIKMAENAHSKINRGKA